MKDKIEELIQNHKIVKKEVNNILEELNQIDSSKLSYIKINNLEMSKLKCLDEVYFRQLFIQDLENLL